MENKNDNLHPTDDARSAKELQAEKQVAPAADVASDTAAHATEKQPSSEDMNWLKELLNNPEVTETPEEVNSSEASNDNFSLENLDWLDEMLNEPKTEEKTEPVDNSETAVAPEAAIVLDHADAVVSAVNSQADNNTATEESAVADEIPVVEESTITDESAVANENVEADENIVANENVVAGESKDVTIEQLHKPEAPHEIDAHVHTEHLTGLTDIKDAELEKILAEDWSQVPDSEDSEAKESEAHKSPEDSESKVSDTPDATTFFTPVDSGNIDEDLLMDEQEFNERKIRPKRKKGYGLFGIPHILATAMWLLLIVAIGVSLGRVLWVCCADVMAFGKEPNQVTITITKEDTIDTISEKLAQADLVRYPGLFKLFATITDKDEDISTGTFTLNSQLDYNAMINAMAYHGATREVVDIMFPDGATCAQIFKLLEEKNVCTVAELEEYAANGELKDYWFLEGVPRGDKYCLEGYMSPDTYKFYTNDEPRRVIEKFLNEFNSRFTDIMKENFVTMQKLWADNLKANGFSTKYIQANPLTLHQVITLASVIQKETSSDNECYTIASVFYNRLTHPDHLLMGSDATVRYAIGDYFGEVKELTQEHLNFDSPYNTRKNKGFPPGPICNFGVHSLYAALEPDETNYYYFVYDKKIYAHRFAETYKQHQNNVTLAEGK